MALIGCQVVPGFPQTTFRSNMVPATRNTFRETWHPRRKPLSGKPGTSDTRTARVPGCRGQTWHPDFPHKNAIGCQVVPGLPHCYSYSHTPPELERVRAWGSLRKTPQPGTRQAPGRTTVSATTTNAPHPNLAPARPIP